MCVFMSVPTPGGLARLHPRRRAECVQAGEEPLGAGTGREQLWRGVYVCGVGSGRVMPSRVVPGRAVSCRFMPCRDMPCRVHAVSCHAVPCHAHTRPRRAV